MTLFLLLLVIIVVYLYSGWRLYQRGYIHAIEDANEALSRLEDRS